MSKKDETTRAASNSLADMLQSGGDQPLIVIDLPGTIDGEAIRVQAESPPADTVMSFAEGTKAAKLQRQYTLVVKHLLDMNGNRIYADGDEDKVKAMKGNFFLKIIDAIGDIVKPAKNPLKDTEG